MPSNELQQRWLSEIGRITPKPDPVDLSSVYQAIARWIEKVLKKIFGADVHIPSPGETALVGITVTIMTVLFVLLIAYLVKRYGNPFSLIRGKFHNNADTAIRREYEALVNEGKFAEAMRFLVRYVSETKSLISRTFAELFHLKRNRELESTLSSYRTALHKNGTISHQELETLEESASRIHPDLAVLSRITKERNR